jgi:hypothetical protein
MKGNAYFHKMNVSGSLCQVTEEDIEEFEASYRGSDSEKKDLKELYGKFEGNMNRYNPIGKCPLFMRNFMFISANCQ